MPEIITKVPTRYFVQYVDNVLYAKEIERVGGVEDAVDPFFVLCTQDTESLVQAHTLQQSLDEQGISSSSAVYERCNIRAVAHSDEYIGPEEWEWDEQVLEAARPQSEAKLIAYQLIRPLELGMSGFAERLPNRPVWREVVVLLQYKQDEEAKHTSEVLRARGENK